MKENLIKLLSKELRNIADKIENGTCVLTEEDAVDILDHVTHIGISRDEAMKELNMSKSTFYLQMSNGNVPKGHKRKGFTELVWFKDEIRKCIHRLIH